MSGPERRRARAGAAATGTAGAPLPPTTAAAPGQAGVDGSAPIFEGSPVEPRAVPGTRGAPAPAAAAPGSRADHSPTTAAPEPGTGSEAAVSSGMPRLVSVVVPAHNEEGTVAIFVEKTAKAFAQIGRPWELLYVDDGSTDSTAARVRAASEAEPRVRLVRQRRNLGLTEALNRGFREAQGEVIVFLPADLESDPAVDIPLLLEKLDEGFDVVSGWRQGRRDGKRVASRVANVTCRVLFGLDVHDLNWIKAFRREVTDSLVLRSSWHRYILVMAQNEGFRIGEVKVPYQARQAGRSKFGFSRLPVSLMDVITLKFLLTFQRKPILFFGAVGSAMIGAGLLLWAFLAYMFLSSHTQYRPLMLVAGISLLAGLLVVLVGFLAELVVNVSERVERLERRLTDATRR